ncbi:amino acid permease [Winogradskyella aurantiaca]|uniref:amino acid permease n=1 Tax=Winogradskyella aurantiaca TaxID=2219558 RepID=UPI000E1D992D|nr:amino acid permease [Winogradskyella aurantiaca]
MKKLNRSISLSSAIAISIGGMLGSGIFVLPGIAAAKTGSSIWLAYLLAAICILPAALSKSELATAMPSSGGTYVYIERTFGPVFGTIAGLGLWLSLLLKSAFALVGFGAYLTVLVNMSSGLTKYIAILFLSVILVLNIFGVKKVGKVQKIIVSISIICLSTILIFGLPVVQDNLLEPFLSQGSTGLFSTVAFVYISYAGVTKIAAIGGEIKNPSVNLPRAMMLSLLIMSAIYVSVAFVLVGNIPMESLSSDIKPIYTIAEILGGKYIGYVVAAVGVITLVSMANSGVLAASRFPFAMAIDQLMPKFMGKIHSRYLTPISTIILTCFVMALAIIFLDVEKIAKLASAFMVMMFISVNACVIILRETATQWYKPAYSSPLYPFMQLFGIVTGIILLIMLGALPILAVITISILGVLIYLRYGKKTSRVGVLRKYGHRPALFLLYKRKRNKKQVHKSDIPIDKSYLDGEIMDDAGVVVPLLGSETSPEMLVEIGAALNTRDKLQVANLTEVPNQTFLEAVVEENPKVNSLARRFSRLATTRDLDVDFESVVTHNLQETIYELSDQTDCDWLVMGWDGKARTGILISNPVGWLVTHINSNLALFKDNGVRYITRVLIALRPGRNDEKFIEVADRICQFYDASFAFLRVVPESISDEELEQMESTSLELIANSKSESKLVVMRSNDSIEAISKASASYDLLVLGTPKVDSWRSVLFGTGKDRFTENSACSVLRLAIKENTD